jgi:hypothetical protein
LTEDELVLEHSIETDVTAAFAWKCRTDIATWNDPPATFLLDGPFAEGAQGTTLRIILSGSNAAAYRETVQTGFGPTLADGMARMSADMAVEFRAGRGPAPSTAIGARRVRD